jgi:hypothetical protein
MPALMLSPEERKRLLLSVGTHRGRRPLSPGEVATLFAKILSGGGTLSDCAEAAQLEGTTWVSRFLRLLSLPDQVKHLIDWGGKEGAVTFSSASEIARLDNDSDEQLLIQGVLTHRLSGSEVRQVVQLRKRSGRPAKDCLDEVVGMRPRIEKRYVYVGALTSSDLKKKLEEMTQNDRDDLLQKVVQQAFPSAGPALSKLGPTTFTLAGDAKFGEQMNKNKETLERDINESLLKATSW